MIADAFVQPSFNRSPNQSVSVSSQHYKALSVDVLDLDHGKSEDMKIVQALVSQLESEGYLTAMSVAGDYAVVWDLNTMKKGRDDYVDPLAGISDMVRDEVPPIIMAPHISIPHIHSY